MNRSQEAWKAYRLKVYDAAPLIQQQDRECSLAFYAGMMAAFNIVVEIGDAAADEEIGSKQLTEFLREISSAAARANLDRSDGKS
jgi:hypothetical protein